MITPVLQTKVTKDVAIVYYHKNCSDGIVAAGVVMKYLDNIDGYAHIYAIPISYGNDIPFPDEDIIKNMRIVGQMPAFDTYFVDYCPTPDELAKFLENGMLSAVTIIDHHQKTLDNLSALKKVINKPTCVLTKVYFSLDHSGASLVEEVMSDLHRGGSVLNRNQREIVEAVRTYDLWEHKGDNLSTAARVSTGIQAEFEEFFNNIGSVTGQPSTLEAMAAQVLAINHAFDKEFNSLLDKGAYVIVNRGFRAQELVSKATWHNGIPVVTDVPGELVNEVANLLSRKRDTDVDFIVMLHKRSWGVKASLRGGNAPRTDLNKLAGLIAPTGGGHVGAAGASITSVSAYQEAAELILSAVNVYMASHAPAAENSQGQVQ